jgi:hypothetical protein
MKKLLGILVLGLLLSGCSENQSETNRKKSTIKLSCEMNKVHLIKKYDGTTADIWYDEKFIKENLAELAKPSIIETNKDSHAIWINGTGTLAMYHDKNGLGYLNEQDTKKKGFITLHLTSINYENLEFISESSMLIKDDDSKFNYNFTNKPEISAKGYGICKKLKWDLS